MQRLIKKFLGLNAVHRIALVLTAMVYTAFFAILLRTIIALEHYIAGKC